MTDAAAILRRFIQKAFDEGRPDAVDAPTAPDFVAPGGPRGREAPKAIAPSLRRAFSDFHLAIEDSATRGDKVWLRLRGTGTHDGPFMGRAPTGRRISVTVIDVMRVVDGRIVEHWGIADGLAARRQIEGPAG